MTKHLRTRSKKISNHSAYFYNKGPTDLVISDIGLKIESGRTIDVFARNPRLSLETYQHSFNQGMLATFMKLERLVYLKEPPIPEEAPSISMYDLPGKPIPSRSKSSLRIDQSIKNYVDTLEKEYLESELPPSSEVLSNEAQMAIDRKQVELKEKFIKQVDLEGFSDPLAED